MTRQNSSERERAKQQRADEQAKHEAPSCGCPNECVHGHNSARIEQPLLDELALDEVALLLAGGAHVTRLRILVVLGDGAPASSKELALSLAQPLGDVAYHMRRLAEYGLVRRVRQEQRRGAIESFYEPTDLGRLLLTITGLARVRAREDDSA